MLEVFKGPLGSHLNYITHIALNNAKDYFDLIRLQKEQNCNETPDKYKRLRIFLNAIESMNNILEYFFHDFKDSKEWQKSDLSRVLGDIRSSHQILRDIALIANAYKHCIRRNGILLHAKDLQSTTLTVSIGKENTSVRYDFDSHEDEQLMSEAFRFWIDYLNNPDKYILLGT